ncbi:phosphate ABC transporter permease PstA [Thiolapillus sp.]|uniref:phosphate ABC transporter permease PstA n=11 Tax=Thiolapillus sp. TaxID=2017437 RepID=UPI003AF82367
MKSAVKRGEVRQAVEKSLVRRRRKNRRFKRMGLGAVVLGMLFLGMMFTSIISKGYSGFVRTELQLEIYFDPQVIDPDGTHKPEVLAAAGYGKLIKQSLRQEFPGVKKRKEKRRLYRLVSTGATQQLRDLVLADPAVIGSHRKLWLIVDDDVDQYYKHGDNQSRLKEQQLASSFNSGFFTSGDSREPELAGIRGAVVGSFFVILITLGLSLPLGVAAAIYLEEFSRRNRWTDFVEVNINNLAAVPSIVFGLLGLAVFINFFELPRSAPLVGGLVLTLMTLPTIIIASRAALKSVPPSIREAALGMGASKMQAVFHHVLPLAMPGMLTGTIIGLAQALGETAPLLMIGMVAFIVDIPGSIMDPATVLPVQIYLWADSPERAFTEKTSAAIMVLLAFLILMNLLAIWLRRKFERRW